LLLQQTEGKTRLKLVQQCILVLKWVCFYVKKERANMNKYDGLAKIIIKNIGGRDNVISLTHCITRLRFKLKNESIAHTELLKNTDGIVTVMQSAGQYQIVIGNHVPDVYAAIMANGKFGGGQSDAGSGQKMGAGAAVIDAISGIFQPLLGVFAGAGILKGVLALLAFIGVLSDTGPTHRLLYSIADGFMYFLPIILGYTASEKFKGNKYIGMAIGASLVYPTLAGLNMADPVGVLFAGTFLETGYQTPFLNIPVIIPKSGYPSSVVPIIAAVFVSVRIERLWKKVIPDVVKTFLVPLFTLLLIVPLTYLVIGPVMSFLSSLLSALFGTLFAINGTVAGLALGAIWQILVIFGLHWAVVPIAIIELGLNSTTRILSPAFAASFAQTAVVLAIIFKTKDRNLKNIAIPAFISGIFGVTESAIYGVTLPKKKPFVISCIGAAIGGAIIGFSGAAQGNIGGLGVFGIPSFIVDGSITSMVWVLSGTLVASVIAFTITMVTYKEEGPAAAKAVMAVKAESSRVQELEKKETLVSPIKGNVTDISEIQDEAFASGALGKGVGIEPVEGKVYAPCDGQVGMVFKTKHAIGLVTEGGTEILIHVGLNTVSLDEKYFDVKVNVGDNIQQGQLLMEFDLEGIKNEGYELTTPVLVTNADQYQEISVYTGREINLGQIIMEIE